MPLPVYFHSTDSADQSRPLNMSSSARTIIAIAAGKGGVGKSAIAVNLALALKEKGFSVGILDADLYGPSIRKMLPEETPPRETKQGVLPGLSNGIKIISTAFFQQEREPNAFRAPIANKIVTSFLQEVNWGTLDFLLIDYPPGTGDIQLTLSQKIHISGAILVTTPQEVAVIDVRKSAAFFEKIKIPILGVIENMSYYLHPETARPLSLLGQGGGKKIAEETQTPLLGQIPIDPLISKCLDEGVSFFQMTQKEAAHSLACLRSVRELLLKQLFAPKKSVGKTPIRFMIEKNGETVTIEWEEGVFSSVDCHLLQQQCPCADCGKQSKPGRFQRETLKTNPEVKALAIHRVGNYGLTFEFSCGCSKSIYNFEDLKREPMN